MANEFQRNCGRSYAHPTHAFTFLELTYACPGKLVRNCGLRKIQHDPHSWFWGNAETHCPGIRRTENGEYVSVEEIENRAEPVIVPPRTLDNALDELLQWWQNTAAADIERSVEKIREYGGSGAARDLIATGRELASLSDRKLDDEAAVELGIYFYMQSKLARWGAAIYEGRRPSDDTIFDLSFYAMMARRNRVVGGWPFPPTDTERNR